MSATATTEIPVDYHTDGHPLYACEPCGAPHMVTAAWCADMTAQLARAAGKAATAGRTVKTGVSAAPGSFGRGPVRFAVFTEKQLNYVRLLITWLAEHDAEWAQKWTAKVDRMVADNRGDASAVIEDLKADLANAKQVARTARANVAPVARTRTALPTVPAGCYAIDTVSDDAVNSVMFVKVWVGRTGFVKVYQQVGSDGVELPWRLVQSVLARIAADGVQAAMVRYGRELGICGHCGRPLTNDASRAAGIGPVCASKI
jgi:hypothetical protein